MSARSEFTEVGRKGMAAYRAPHLHQPHKARQAVRDAHEGRISPLIGYFSGFGSAPVARVLALLGADFIFLDWEHCPMDVETMTAMVHDIQFMSEGRTIPFVRIPNHDHASIGFALDAGASIIVPQVDTVEQAEHIVASTKFGSAAEGTRSAPPARLFGGVADVTANPSRTIWQNLNEQAALVIQMESARGINNLDAILTAVGHHIDAVFLGVLDLRVSLGFDGTWGTEPEFLALVDKFESTLKKHDKPFAGPAFGRDWVRAEGKALVVVGGDFMALWAERKLIEDARLNITGSSGTKKSNGQAANEIS